MIKKIDSTIHIGAAEKYITKEFDSFRRYTKGLYPVSDIKNVDMNKIISKFNLKGFVFGNYVSQVERHYFIFKLEKQMEFLSKIKGNNNIGKGNLIIGFGADGKGGSLAHFNPRDLFINLNKGSNVYDSLQGENSFIHEYAHYLDFAQGRKDKNINFNFACEAEYSTDKNTQIFVDFLNIAYQDESYFNKLNTEYLRKKIEIFARLFESTIQIMVDEDPYYTKYFKNRYSYDRYLKKEKIENSNAIKLIKQILRNS